MQRVNFSENNFYSSSKFINWTASVSLLIFFIRNEFILSLTDIDWEFPNFEGKTQQDKKNFVLLLQAIKRNLIEYSLSIALGTGTYRYGLSYDDIVGIFAAVDFVNVMTYDLHGGWDKKTGNLAPLYRGTRDQTNQNVDYCIRYLIQRGAPKDKIVVGIPCYGNGFKLNDPNNNGIGAPAVEGKQLAFSDICWRLKAKSLTYRWEDQQKAPYAFNGNEWIGFDSVRSVTVKANYINKMGLGGAMFWALDSDDYSNRCNLGKFPLISTVKKIINRATDVDSFSELTLDVVIKL